MPWPSVCYDGGMTGVLIALALAIVAGMVMGAHEGAKKSQASWEESQEEEAQRKAFEIYRWLTREDWEALGKPEWVKHLVGSRRYAVLMGQWYPPSQPTRTGTPLDAYLA